MRRTPLVVAIVTTCGRCCPPGNLHRLQAQGFYWGEGDDSPVSTLSARPTVPASGRRVGVPCGPRAWHSPGAAGHAAHLGNTFYLWRERLPIRVPRLQPRAVLKAGLCKESGLRLLRGFCLQPASWRPWPASVAVLPGERCEGSAPPF